MNNNLVIGHRIQDYINKLMDVHRSIVVTTADGDKIALEIGIDETFKKILDAHKKGGKVYFVGNGGSATIASHMAVDFWKSGGIRSDAFNDAAQLTCLGNDYGYEHVFGKPIEMHGRPEDMLVAISSSGKSANILNAVKAAREKGMKVISLSGFEADNPLRQMGDVNFYVKSKGYGPVEITHLSICHAILDLANSVNRGEDTW